jgi:hypothetical protein
MGRSKRWSGHVVEEMTIISRDVSLEHFTQSSRNGCDGEYRSLKRTENAFLNPSIRSRIHDELIKISGGLLHCAPLYYISSPIIFIGLSQ